ncbi:MAG: DUF4186 domain-containing protein [Hyphomicrobium sp.]|uniref:DUF4186 domain-containing protein n=1 Tax=Hyphomicrobium sp. TaxID=82 RepID=UPI003D0CD825
MKTIDDVLAELAKSKFRRRFRLAGADRAYLGAKGLAHVLDHARGFIETRLAPAEPRNDGRQTPFRGHPVFVAQHATASCCRSCIAKWHAIPRGRPMTAAEMTYVLDLLQHWLRTQCPDPAPLPAKTQGELQL